MTKLSFVADEARRVSGRISEKRLHGRAEAVQKLCDTHWLELRGPEPHLPLAKILWNARPASADLFVSLVAEGDPRLAPILGRLSPAQALAILVLAAIDRGEGAEAGRLYEAMKLYEPPNVADAYARRVVAKVRGQAPKAHAWHKHSSRASVWKALAAVTAETGRDDLNAIVGTIDYLGELQRRTIQPSGDPLAARLLRTLRDLGVTFLGTDRGRLRYQVRGVERKAVSLSRLPELLGEAGRA